MRYNEILNESERLNEKGFWNSVGTIAKNAASKTGYSVLGALGSKNADGQNDRITAANALMKEFQEYLGRLDIKPSWASVKQFLYRRFPNEMNDTTEQVLANSIKKYNIQARAKAAGKPVPTDAQITANQEKFSNRPGKTSNTVGKGDDRSGLRTQNRSDNMTNYENQTMKQISNLIRQPGTSRGQVMGLVKELINHANDFGGQEKERVVQYLRSLRKSNAVITKFPDLGRMKFESRQIILNYVIMLVEASQYDYNPIDATVLPRSVIDKIFKEFSGILMHQGGVSFSRNNPKKSKNDEPNYDFERSEPRMTNSSINPQTGGPSKNATAVPTSIDDIGDENVASLGKLLVNQKHLDGQFKDSGISDEAVELTKEYANGSFDEFMHRAKRQKLPAYAFKAVVSGLQDRNGGAGTINSFWKKPVDAKNMTDWLSLIDDRKLNDNTKSLLSRFAEKYPTFGQFMDAISKDARITFTSDTMTAILASVKA